MPARRSRGPSRSPAAALVDRSEWVGGRVELPLYITEAEPYRPHGVMWVELPSRLIVSFTAIDPRATGPSFADTLREAMRSPHAGPPRRPPRVRVASGALAEEARAALAAAAREGDAAASPASAVGLDATTEVVVAPTPEIDELMRLFLESLPGGDEPDSYLEGGRVPTSAMRELFRAARVLHHAAPWKQAQDEQVVRLDVPEMGIGGAAISIIGALGQNLGFLIFPSLDGFDAYLAVAERHDRDIRTGRAPKHLDLGTSVLSLTFDRAADLPAPMRKEAMEHGWPVAGTDAYPRVMHVERDGLLRPLTERDVRLVSECAFALTAFALKHAALFAGTSTEPVSESYTGGETEVTVRLTAPYEAFELFEEVPEGGAPARFPSLEGFARDESAELGPGWFSVPLERTPPGLPIVSDLPPPRRAASSAGAARRVGRNEPCPCGSGKKYKRCHLGGGAVGAHGPGEGRDAASGGPTAPPETAALHELDRTLVAVMSAYARERFGASWSRYERDFDDAEAGSQLSLHWSLYHLRVRGRTVAEHFVAECGDRLSADERAWLEAQSRSWLSIWEVVGAEPGVSLDLEDLLSGERRHVTEASGSRALLLRSAVLARIVDHAGVSLICGSHPQPLPPLEAAEVVSAFRGRSRRARTAAVERLREERLGRDLIAHWEAAVADLQARSRVPPHLHNTDGDALVFVADRYEIDPAARAEIEARLAASPGVVAPEAGDAERDYVFHRAAPTRAREEDLIVGHATVGERSLTLETNSLRRADALRRRVEAALGPLVRHRRRGRRDAQRMAERAWERGPRERPARGDGYEGRRQDDASALAEARNSPEAQQMLREMKERHYADWADQPLPALGGKTAREAVRSARGRERVDALVKSIEQGEAMQPVGERFDTSVLRRSLGL